MTSIREALGELRTVSPNARENRRTELIDLAAQAVEAMQEREGLGRSSRTSALITRIDQLRQSGSRSVADALSEVREAANAPLQENDPWERLCTAVEVTIDTCGAEEITATQRTHGVPVSINHVFVEAAGETRTFGLWHGDVTAQDKVRLFIVSAYTKPGDEFGGQVVKELGRRFGCSLSYKPFLLLEEGAATTYVPAYGAAPAILVLSAPVAADRLGSDEWFSRYSQWVRGCFASIAALEFLGESHEVIALPVLFGNRWVPVDQAMQLMIQESAKWLRRSRTCQEIRFTVFQQDDLAKWSTAMDAVLGRTAFHVPEDHEAGRHRRSILSWSSQASGEDAELIRPLRDALKNADSLEPAPICNAARQAGEALALERLVRLGFPTKNSLQPMIESLHKHAPPMVIAHLQVLRALGNAYSHYSEDSPTAATTTPRFIAEALRSVWMLLQLRVEFSGQ